MAPILIVLTVLFSIAAAVLAFIFIIPADRVPRNGLFIFLHNLLNFKYFIIEKIMSFLYVFSTAATLIGGFFYLFTVKEDYYPYYNYNEGYYDYRIETEWVGYWGFVIMILGPIVVRLVYELIMMGLTTIRNIAEINRKIPGNPSDELNNFGEYNNQGYNGYAPYQPGFAPAPEFQAPPASGYTPAPEYQAPAAPGYQAPAAPGYQAPAAPAYQAPAAPGYAPAPEYQAPAAPGYAPAPEYQAPAAPGYAPAPEIKVNPEISINI